MRSPPPRPIRWLLAALTVMVVLTGCEGDRTRSPVRSIKLAAPDPVLRPGSTMRLTAEPLGADGQPVETALAWQSLTPNLASVDATGVVLAKAPGIATIRVSAGQISADVDLELRNPPAATLQLAADSVELFLPDGAASLAIVVEDADGLPIIGAPLQWESAAARLVTVNADGTINAKAAGVTLITVTLEGLRDSVVVAVSAVSSLPSPVITAVTPSTIVPGQPVVITGSRFSLGLSANIVLVDGLPMVVDTATRSRLVARLPAGAPCLPTSAVSLQVTNLNGSGVAPVTLQTAPQNVLDVGEAIVLTTASAAACNEIALDGGEYLITLSHAARTIAAGTVALQMTGEVGAGATTSGVATSEVATTDAIGAAGVAARDPVAVRRWRAHEAVLAGSRAAVALAAPVRVSPPPRAELQVPPVNGIVNVRIPNLDASTNICGEFTSIGARTVFAGPHLAILEDTASKLGGVPLLTGQMDAVISALGAEAESVMWPVATTFGNPLVMDDRLDANGQVVIVLTPRMNVMRNGDLLAATVTCDFFPRSALAASNVGEMVYLQVPTRNDPGMALGTLTRWRFDIRSTIVHELKHVTSYAERLIRGQPLEEVWLEEATARHAEELYARQVYGRLQRGDATFAQTVRCELRDGGVPPGCGDEPRMMRNHLDGLWDFLDAPASHSPLGPATPGDVSFYGSAWALTRWAIDQSATPEATILSGLTLSGQSGVTNLEARIGLPWEVFVPLWSLAMLTDGTADSVASAQLRFPSWNVANLFAGLCDALGPCAVGGESNGRYGRAHPARPMPRPVGEFALLTQPIQPGGFIAFRMSGTVSTGRQLLQVRGGTGGPIPSTVRLAILRVN